MKTNSRFVLSETVRRGFCDLARNNADTQVLSDAWNAEARNRFRGFRPDKLARIIAGDEYQREIDRELSQLRAAIEHRLPGKAVRHFCVPWYVASDRALLTVADCGYRSAFLGELAFGSGSELRSDDSIIKVPGLSANYIFRLPGAGRASLLDVLRRKV